MEKTKDILYYIGDFLACVLILSLMYFLVSWKLGDSLPVSYETGKARAEAARRVDENKVVIESKGPNEARSDDKKTGAGTDTGKSDNINKTDGSNSANTDKTSETKTGDDAKKDEKKNEKKEGVVTITVESGMSAVDIAYMLEEKGLVDSADLFVAKLESLGLTSSLQIGDFEIRQGMNYEEVAAVLTAN